MAGKHFAGSDNTSIDGLEPHHVKPNTSILEGGTGMAARTHQLSLWCLTGLPLLLTVGKSGIFEVLLASALTAGLAAVYTTYCLLDEHDVLPKVGLSAICIIIVWSTLLSYPPLTWLMGVPLTALSLWLGYQTGPYARPVAEAIERAYRRYLIHRLRNG